MIRYRSVQPLAFLCLAVAFLVARPTLSQTSRNIEAVGRIALPPIPPASPPGLVSDLWVASDRAAATPYGFAYVGRYRDLPLRVEVFDVTNPALPTFRCSAAESTTGDEVEDVVVEDRFLYVATQDDDPDIDGVQVHDLVNLAAPSCTGPSFFISNIASAHDLFFYDHSSGMRLLVVATMMPDALMAVHLVDATNPGAPVWLNSITWPTADAYCMPVPGLACGPHDIYVHRDTSGRDILAVAALGDGAHLYDISNVLAPLRLSHFVYYYRTPDIDGDGASDFCDLFGDGEADDANFDGVVDDLDKTYRANTHDARITPDGNYLWTADERGCGAHILIWPMADITAQCSDADGCPLPAPSPPYSEIAPFAEFALKTPMPYSVHQIRWYSPNVAMVTWYEEGLRILGHRLHDAQAPITDVPIAPVEMAFFDSLEPNTDGCIDNGFPGNDNCRGVNPPGPSHRVQNPGFGGDWGVSWDDCYIYIADRGSPDNNEAPPENAGSEGALIALRYTGGPTSPQPLRITKAVASPGDLVASWGDVPFASSFNIYRGTIPRTATGGGLGTRPAGSEYDHSMITTATCDVVGSSRSIVNQYTPIGATCNNQADDDGDTLIDCADNTAGAENCSADQSCQPFAYYYLVTARSPCDDAANREGNYGQDSFSTDRPTADPSVGCPTCQTCPL